MLVVVFSIAPLVLLLGPLAPSAALEAPTTEGLDNPDVKVRFEAAMRLANSPSRRVPAVVKNALRQESFRSSAEARAAANFVLWKRSGKKLPPARLGQTKRPNIIIISVDTLRPDHLGCYGYARATSPVIDRLAKRGVLFRNAYSTSSWTMPAHMSLFTSLYPSFHKLEQADKLRGIRLDDSEKTLAQLLKGSGYATAGFVAHTFLDAEWGFDRGFDIYARYDTHAKDQTERASLWLEWHRFHASRGMAPEPFFLFVHYYDPHETYDAPAPYKRKYAFGYVGPLLPQDMLAFLFADMSFQTPADLQFAVDLYDGEISYVDAQLGRLFDKVDDMGLASSTAIIFASDHGEEFKEHGSMGHRHTLYDEVVRIPLLISFPRHLEAGQVVEDPVSLIDIVPTVLSLTGVMPLEKAQGTNLVPRLKLTGSSRVAQPLAPRSLFFELGPSGSAWELPLYRKAIRRDGDKLIYTYLENGTLIKELYPVGKAPEERWNTYDAGKNPDSVQRLEQSLLGFMEEGDVYNPGFRAKNEFEIDDEALEQLRALGYVE